MREIITFQVGASSNFVGSHFWNFQEGNEDTEASILYRNGQTEKRIDTVHPRVLIFDDYDNLGSYRPGGYSYHQEQYSIYGDEENDRNHLNENSNSSSNITRSMGTIGGKGEEKGKEAWDYESVSSLNAKFGNFVSLQGVNSAGSTCGTEAINAKWKSMESLPWHGRVIVDKRKPIQARNIFTDYAGDDDAYYKEQTYLTTQTTSEDPSDGLANRRGGGEELILNSSYKKEHHYKYWTEFTLQDFHPKSISAINASLDPLNQWTYTDDMSDKFRFFAEEADSVQGIHLFNDLHQRCYGLTISLLEDIHDQYTSAPILSFLSPSLLPRPAIYSTSPNYFQTSMKDIDERRALQCIDHIQTARVLRFMMEECNGAIVPLLTNLNSQTGDNVIFPGLNLHPTSSQYTTSAVHAVAVDTATSIYRMKNSTVATSMGHEANNAGKCNMKDYTRWLAHGCVPLFSLEMDFPWPHPSHKINSLKDFESFLEPNLKNIKDVLSFRPSKGFLSTLKPLSFPYKSISLDKMTRSGQRYSRYSGAATVRGCTYDINHTANNANPSASTTSSSSGRSLDSLYSNNMTGTFASSSVASSVNRDNEDINMAQVERTMNEQLKYYPWFQPNVNTALRSRIGLTYEFPTALWDHRMASSSSASASASASASTSVSSSGASTTSTTTTTISNGKDEGRATLPLLLDDGADPRLIHNPSSLISRGASCLTWMGCTSGLRPWLQDITSSCEEALKYDNHACNIRRYMKGQYGLDENDLEEVREYIIEVTDQLSQEVNSFEDDEDDIDLEN